MNKPVKVLILEDSEDDAKLALRALRRAGFDPTHRRVQTAEELTTALAQERWDAVISDYAMPGFTGIDALKIFRSTGLDIPFILISGTIGEETAVNAMKAGASDYVMKKNLARLAPALERELKETQMRAAYHHAQRELVESEQRLRTIIETEPECVKVVSSKGVLLEMNASGLAMLEADSLAAVRSRRLLDFIVPEYHAAFADLHKRVIRGESGILEYEVIGLKGGRRWLETHAAPLGGVNGEEAMLLGITRDITERKRAKQALLQLQRQSDLILESVVEGIYVIDIVGRVIFPNPAAAKLFGYGIDELSGRPAHATTHHTSPDGTPFLIAHCPIHITMLDGAVRRVEDEVFWRKDGSSFPVEYTTAPIRDDRGDITGAVVAFRDITERKAAERTIGHLNRVYAMLSGINTLIVRIRDRDELFREACRIAVEAGGFRMSLIGIVDQGTKKIIPVASAGKDEELLTAIKGVLSSSEDAQYTMVARAIRDKKAVVSNDSQSDSRVFFSMKYAESGVRSMAVLPLIVAHEAVGVLALYASESEFFHEEEMKLVTELAGDIAFAIDHIAKQERLDYLAYYDVLTGLANRRLFLERVAQYMRSAVSGGHKLAVFLIDLERFKNINDSLGRPAGDALLKQVTEWLTRNAGDANLLARIDVDHFALVMPEVTQEGGVARLLEKTMESFVEHPFRLNDAVFRIAYKVGVALFPNDGDDADTLLRNAEAALKKAKASGEHYLFYTQKMTEAVASKLSLENQLRQALDNEEFVLHYQPKVNLASGRLTGAEALIRWNDPRTGLVPPGRFIPILEETGLIHDVGRWALRQAVADYLRWRAAGLEAVRIAVNVSPLQLRNRDFIAEIGQAIGVDAHAPAGLEIEITESLIMADVKHSITSLQAIRALGVTIAIDDFGTGFSSLSYLSKLPVDTLKIDRSFVIDMPAGPEGLALVSTIINLAHSMNLKVVAEGVETEEQSRLLRLLDCDEMQGFVFSKPVPMEIFEEKFLAPPPAG